MRSSASPASSVCSRSAGNEAAGADKKQQIQYKKLGLIGLIADIDDTEIMSSW
jgi:phosphatidate phosphatase APP1